MEKCEMCSFMRPAALDVPVHPVCMLDQGGYETHLCEACIAELQRTGSDIELLDA